MYAGLVMSFYSIYVFEGLVELYALEQEHLAIAQGGRLISTHKGHEFAWETAIALAKEKQLPLVDRTNPTSARS
jgi:hypothetical protein